jgi:hypothetical protein
VLAGTLSIAASTNVVVAASCLICQRCQCIAGHHRRPAHCRLSLGSVACRHLLSGTFSDTGKQLHSRGLLAICRHQPVLRLHKQHPGWKANREQRSRRPKITGIGTCAIVLAALFCANVKSCYFLKGTPINSHRDLTVCPHNAVVTVHSTAVVPPEPRVVGLEAPVVCVRPCRNHQVATLLGVCACTGATVWAA